MPPTDPSSNRRDFLVHAGKGVLAAGLIAATGSAIASAATPLAPPDKQPANLKLPKPPQKKIGYAIMGLGNLALNQILPAFAEAEKSAAVALVSGHREKAEKVAAHYGIDPKNIYSYDNYDSIKDNQAVDAIYNVLPNSMHAEYTIRGLQAGKHVLCEKPMADSVTECQQMIDAGKETGKKLMIAYRLHYEPYNQTMIEMSRKQAYGPVRVISAEDLQNTRAPNIRLSKQLGGGPLGDVGVYCINACRYITGEEPVEVTAMSWTDPKDERFREVPTTVLALLRFPSGVLAQCACGFGEASSKRYRVTATDGYYELESAFGYSGQKLMIHNKEGQEVRFSLPQVNHFAKEMDHFAECIEKDTTPWTPGEEGLADQRVMDAIERSIAEGRTVKV
jgi:predicted dehydrogenase